MKRVVGNYFTDTEADFVRIANLLETAGLEVARQGGITQAVIIEDAVDEVETEEN